MKAGRMKVGRITAERLFGGPILQPFMERRMGGNLNGPSLIRTPDWLACRLGRYHLYFAHHLGGYIRLAYADRLEGPWRVHGPGVLDIAQTPMLMEHIASPDVHIDEDRRELRMYFHGISDPEPAPMPTQSTCVAHSFDGVTFAARPQMLGESYFRVWRWRGEHYALALGGGLWRSPDGLAPFRSFGRLAGLPEGVRHPAVLLRGDTLRVAWTVLGDCPERIFIGAVDLAQDFDHWRIETAQQLLRPEHAYEGADRPLEPSRAGVVTEPAHQLRDPAFYSEGGVDYLLYAVAGESGIAMARLHGLDREYPLK